MTPPCPQAHLAWDRSPIPPPFPLAHTLHATRTAFFSMLFTGACLFMRSRMTKNVMLPMGSPSFSRVCVLSRESAACMRPTQEGSEGVPPPEGL